MLYFFLEISMENQINMDDLNTQQYGQNPVSQPVQIPEKPRVNYLMISLIIFICFLIFGLGGYYMGTKNQNKTSDNSNILPIPIMTSPPKTTVPPTNIPTLQPTAVKSVLQSITLKVAAIGGGAGGDRYDYVFTFNADPEDKIVVLKRDVNEIKNFPGYNQGAFDKGMVIKHGTVDLEITPSFEGAGITPLKNKNPVIISNIALTDAPIYRINQSNIDILQGANYTPRVGSYYTLWYKEKPEDCSMLGEATPPACVFSAGVTLRDEHDLSIFCTAEDDRATWCDDIVKSLNVSVSKYTN